ncbi:PQQ-binding-like beta-propeller repeat protein [Streptomyces sp. BE303]|uniref:PQQ-binding-like beta-propeller repeat protein n=1 Tax=Streptomyces sp. BE303 TaxID=3002528 RepID=UPI002E77521B|nr:PQQ-binding-like beta-propeller repeat protein [Streptomyces sp. BE303]MED7951349.1 PQQ-binding-like beta-propeller repeat protein [Streptomyces sp. BE303]
MTSASPSRRQLLLGAGTVTALTALGVGPAAAAAPRSPRAPEVTGLGPGNADFPLMSATLLGETLWIGSRNLAPAKVVGYHVPTGRVTATATLPTGNFVQGSAAHGGRLYLGVTDAPKAVNLYRLDPADGSVRGLVNVPGADVRDVAVAPDGVVFATGRQKGRAAGPGLYAYDPATGVLTEVASPAPGATQGRAVEATATHAYLGVGSNLAGGGGATLASLFAVERATGRIADITPPELAADTIIRQITALGDDLLAVSTEGKPAHVAFLDPATHTVLRSFPVPGTKSITNFQRLGDTVWFTSTEQGVVWRYRLAAGTLEQFAVPVPDGNSWGLGRLGDTLVGVTEGGTAWTLSTSTAAVTTTDLVAAGAPAEAQLGMSLAARNGRVYVGGNGSIALHDLRAGTVRKLPVPGEAKDTVILDDDTLYLGVYSSQGIWRYNPWEDTEPVQEAVLPQEQNRPQTIRWDEEHGLLLLGVQADTTGGGSFVTYRPGSGRPTVHVDPLGSEQLVRAVAVGHGQAFLGGDNAKTTGPRGDLAAWDPEAGRELWRIGTNLGSGISSLAVHGRWLFGITVNGQVFSVDLRTARRRPGGGAPAPVIGARADLRAITSANPRLLVVDDRLYGISERTLFRLDPETLAATVLVQVDAEWYSGARVAADDGGVLYTLRGRELIAVRDR